MLVPATPVQAILCLLTAVVGYREGLSALVADGLAQTSFSLKDLDFTCDDLNNHFLSVADKTVRGISFTNISLLSFITVNAPMFHLNTVSDDTVISVIYI